jgi:hypothetical protein
LPLFPVDFRINTVTHFGDIVPAGNNSLPVQETSPRRPPG